MPYRLRLPLRKSNAYRKTASNPSVFGIPLAVSCYAQQAPSYLLVLETSHIVGED